MNSEIKGSSWEQTIGDRLRKARELTGMTKEEFAEKTEISRTVVANLESGVGPYKQPYLITWAHFTGASLEWLKTGEMDPNNSQARQGAA